MMTGEKMNKKGIIIELIVFIVAGIVIVLFFAGIIYGWGLVNDIVSSPTMDFPGANLTDAASKTITPLNTGFLNLRLIALAMMIAYVIGTFIIAYFSSKHPIWLFVYILITVILVIFSVYISNTYETMKNNTVLGPTLTGFTGSNVIISYLPIWVAIIGSIGCVISVVGINMSRRIFEE